MIQTRCTCCAFGMPRAEPHWLCEGSLLATLGRNVFQGIHPFGFAWRLSVTRESPS